MSVIIVLIALYRTKTVGKKNYLTSVGTELKQQWLTDNLCNHYATVPPQENENVCIKRRREKGGLAESACLIGQAVLFHIPLTVRGAALLICQLGLAVQSEWTTLLNHTETSLVGVLP